MKESKQQTTRTVNYQCYQFQAQSVATENHFSTVIQ
jgi:hypothetical protein